MLWTADCLLIHFTHRAGVDHWQRAVSRQPRGMRLSAPPLLQQEFGQAFLSSQQAAGRKCAIARSGVRPNAEGFAYTEISILRERASQLIGLSDVDYFCSVYPVRI